MICSHWGQKVTELRRAESTFRDKYGFENTVGIERALVTDYMSSEVTDGPVTESSSSRTEGKKLNVEPVGWRSKQVSNCLLSVMIN